MVRGLQIHKGTPWEITTNQKRKWLKSYQELVEFYQKHGHSRVNTYQPKTKLASWTINQRKKYHLGKLSPEQIEQLEKVDFVWDASAYKAAKFNKQWMVNYQKLLDYKKEYGHININNRGIYQNIKLGQWLERQRNAKKLGKLTAGRIEQLEKIAFVWSTSSYYAVKKEKQWMVNYQKFLDYKKEFGHVNIENRAIYQNSKLGLWVSRQRKAKRLGKLLPEQIEKLENVGFAWDTSAYKPAYLNKYWMGYYQKLLDYKKEFGQINIKNRGVYQNSDLGRWVFRQKKAKKLGKLTAEQIEQLEKVDFAWDTNSFEAAKLIQQWMGYYQKLLDYKKEYGHVNIPAKEVYQNSKLGQWVSRQRKAKKLGKLKIDRLDLLEKIGFKF